MNDRTNSSSFPVIVSLGSNINPESNLRKASHLLAKQVEHIQFSSIWESPAVGSSGPNYLNSAALLRTNLSLEAIKATLIAPVEDRLGRIRSADKYMDRTIDIDVLIYGDQVVDPELWILAHLAIPASELDPDFLNIETGQTLLETADKLAGEVEIIQRMDLA